MHIIGIREFCCFYQIVKKVDFFQLERSYNPFKYLRRHDVTVTADAAEDHHRLREIHLQDLGNFVRVDSKPPGILGILC